MTDEEYNDFIFDEYGSDEVPIKEPDFGKEPEHLSWEYIPFRGRVPPEILAQEREATVEKRFVIIDKEIPVMRPRRGVMQPSHTTLKNLVGGGMSIRDATYEEFLKDVQNDEDDTYIYWRRIVIGCFDEEFLDEYSLISTDAVVIKLHDHPILDAASITILLDEADISFILYSTPFNTAVHTDLVCIIPLDRPVSLPEHEIVARKIMKILGVELAPQEYDPAEWALQPQCCRGEEIYYVYKQNFDWE